MSRHTSNCRLRIWRASTALWKVVAIGVVAVGALVSARPAGAVLVYVKGDSREVVAARNDGSHAHVIARGSSAFVSPDGRWVAVVARRTGPTPLLLVPIGGRRARVLIPSVAVVTGTPPPPVRWSLDGRFLVAESGGDRTGAYVFDVRRHRRRFFPSGYADFVGGTFSPDDSVLVGELVRGARNTTVDLHAYRVRGRARGRRVVANAGNPLWGPRGIAYLGGRGLVFKRRLSQRHARRLARHAVTALVAWSANGDVLLTEAFVDSVWDQLRRDYVYSFSAALIDLRSGRATPLPGLFNAVDGVSRDGKTVLAESGGNVVTVTPGGATRVLASGASSASWTR